MTVLSPRILSDNFPRSGSTPNSRKQRFLDSGRTSFSDMETGNSARYGVPKSGAGSESDIPLSDLPRGVEGLDLGRHLHRLYFSGHNTATSSLCLSPIPPPELIPSVLSEQYEVRHAVQCGAKVCSFLTACFDLSLRNSHEVVTKQQRGTLGKSESTASCLCSAIRWFAAVCVDAGLLPPHSVAPRLPCSRCCGSAPFGSVGYST